MPKKIPKIGIFEENKELFEAVKMSDFADFVFVSKKRPKELPEKVKLLWGNEEEMAKKFHALRKKESIEESKKLMKKPPYMATMLLKEGYFDILIGGIEVNTKNAILPPLKILKTGKRATSLFLLRNWKGNFVISDTSLIIDPSPEDLLEIVKNAAIFCHLFVGKPKIALLSFSTHGSAEDPNLKKMEFVESNLKLNFDYELEKEVQVDAALIPWVAKKKGARMSEANTLIFPNIWAGNIGLKLIEYFSKENTSIGPIVMGLSHRVGILSRRAQRHEIKEIFLINKILWEKGL
jgi:phosphate acetyltransferase